MSTETIKPLRPRTATDDLIGVIKVVAWALVGIVILLLFFTMVFGALRSPEVFVETVLRLALITIAIVLTLVVINVIQRIITDRQEVREKEKLDQAAKAVQTMMTNAGAQAKQDSLRPFFDRLDILELASIT